ncbi:MAG: DNA polymerase III subunit delta [Candidatus Hydrogenedentes bacterium]|nr:DNA polymerase III subunit delta [Candidatus Hydrogenedentota bacterium]
MNLPELKKRIADAPPPSHVILVGPGAAPFQREPYDPVVADMAVAALVKRYVDPSMADMIYHMFYADEAKIGEIVLEAQTLPFLAEYRVIVVRNTEKYNAMSGERNSALGPLIAYIESPCPSTLLILVASKLDKRKRFYKACKEHGAIVECPELDEKALHQWVVDKAQFAGKHMDGRAIQAMLHRSGNRLGDVQNALNLLITYVGDSDRIRAEDVEAACADVAEEQVWALTDAIAESNPKRALHALQNLFDLGKAPDEIMGLINWLLDSAYRAAPETAVKLQSQFVARKVMPLVEKLGLEKIKRACSMCTEAHLQIRTTGVDAELTLEMLVIKLSVPQSRVRKVSA